MSISYAQAVAESRTVYTVDCRTGKTARRDDEETPLPEDRPEDAPRNLAEAEADRD